MGLRWPGILALVVGVASSASAQTHMTSASNVRMRASPALDAAIVATLALGTELTVLESTTGEAPWHRVRAKAAREGWVLGILVRALQPGQELAAVEAIVLRRLPADIRLGNGAGESVDSRIQTVDLIERVSGVAKDRETAARFAWYHLRALDHAATAVSSLGSGANRYASWFQARESFVVHNEVGASWMIRRDHGARIHDTYADTAAADEIAWLLAGSGVRGECEGDIPCYMSRVNVTDGAYLRWHPNGRHTEAASASVAKVLNDIFENLQRYPRVLAEFTPSTRCGDLHEHMDPLRAAVANASSPDTKTIALAAIDRYARLCARVQ